MPLFVRISATDWLEEASKDEIPDSWKPEDTVKIAKQLADAGVDMLGMFKSSHGALYSGKECVLTCWSQQMYHPAATTPSSILTLSKHTKHHSQSKSSKLSETR